MSTTTQIPLVDLAAQHAAVGDELAAAIERVVASNRFIGGPELADFEEAYALYCEVDHAIGVANGTTALTLILRAAGIGPGDEVVTTTMTFIATVESIAECGATPVLVDANPATALSEADAIAAAVTGRTRAVVAVHLYGQPVDMTAYRQVADEHGVYLFEDAAQAHGARWRGVRAGALGDAAAFSFFPGKNLGALGDAGGVTSANAGLAERVRLLRDHGRSDKYLHRTLGTNGRMDALQAAVLAAKLPLLEEWNDARRAHAQAYDAAFAEVEGVTPIAVHPDAEAVYHQYVVRVADRDAALERLKAAGISAGIHYPVPVHQQPAVTEAYGTSSLPYAETLAAEVLSLPVYPELDDAARDRIVDTLAEHVAERA